MKKTAVDYLYKELWNKPKDKYVWTYILNKAKEIEKKQIIESYLNSSAETCYSFGENPPSDDTECAENYYSRTYERK